MLTKKLDKVYLLQILEHLQDLKDYLQGYTFKDFQRDKKTQSAVILKLMVVGELSKKISPSVKSNIHQPWKDIAGFRDLAIHHYEGLDLNIVWDAAVNYAPSLKRDVARFIKTLKVKP